MTTWQFLRYHNQEGENQSSVKHFTLLDGLGSRARELAKSRSSLVQECVHQKDVHLTKCLIKASGTVSSF